MQRRTFRIGTRKSPLALKQVDEIANSLKKFYPGFAYEIKGIDTYGDKDKLTPISEIEGRDFFAREIEQALLEGEIDFAVHSAKDLPDKIAQGLSIAAITKPIDPYDALVSKGNLKLNELRKGAKIGASSRRRKTQLKKYRADLQIVDIRGNIEERLKLLNSCGYRVPSTEHRDLDAIIVAACALIRLGLQDMITQRIPFKILKPHSLQGALAVEVKENNRELIDLLRVLNEPRPS